MSNRVCRKCGKPRRLTSFGLTAWVALKDGTRKRYRTHECKSCENERVKQWVNEHPGYAAGVQQRYRERNADHYKYTHDKGHARRKGRVWLIDYPSWLRLVLSRCHYCGVEQPRGLDRLDSGGGYTAENVVPCCKVCNRMKSDLTKEEFLAHIKRIAGRARYSGRGKVQKGEGHTGQHHR